MRKLVTINGCFNGLHSGHLFYLGFALGQGTELIVGINSDEYIRRKKGYSPIPEAERVKAIQDLGIAKCVCVFYEDDPREFIRKTKPDIHCLGAEYRDNAVEIPLCVSMGIKMVFIPRIGKWSTRAMLKESAA